MAKTSASKTSRSGDQGFEESLWDTANKLRGSVESSEYKHIVLSLIFLKFIFDKFNIQRQKIIELNGADFFDMVDSYNQYNVFYLPEDSRWSYVLEHAKQGDIALKVDSALYGIEGNNRQLASALPGQLFYTTQIPVCLWFLTKSKRATEAQGTKGREGETLFIDARQMGTMVSRTNKELTTDDIAEITRTYHAWRGGASKGTYEDRAGFCKAATLKEIAANDYVLTPGRYVGAAEIEDDGVLFATKMAELSQTLYKQMDEADKLDRVIRDNLKVLGYGTAQLPLEVGND